VGHEGSPVFQPLLEYAERNRIPYRWLNAADSTQSDEIRARGLDGSRVKVVVRGRLKDAWRSVPSAGSSS
jgi:hypothetical protein